MANSRDNHWQLGGVSRRLPIYFPSVSSVKTIVPPVDYVHILNALVKKEQYLVSAYDLIRCDSRSQEEIILELEAAKEEGTLVLVDSGNYEGFWKTPNLRWAPEEFHKALKLLKPNIAFGFDNQSPPIDKIEHLRQLNAQYVADSEVSPNTLVVPIVHGDPSHLVQICPSLVRDQKIEAIAVPERALGAGVNERVESVMALRKALNETGIYVKLHLLGTGNPISIALYSNAGADSFDGLEWCQTVVDHETALLHHFSQGDFFRQQTKWGGADLTYVPRTLGHNLEFYRDWMHRLADAMEDGEGDAFCRHNFPERIYVQCNVAVRARK